MVVCLQVNAQVAPSAKTITVTGSVRSVGDSAGIPFAHVFLAGKVTGTVTNSEGLFELKVPAGYSNSEISFSALGYKTQSVPLEAESSALVSIFLDTVAYQLEEVVVTDAVDSAALVLSSAIRSIKSNYPVRPHLMEGFFRELSFKDTSYTRLIEAAVRVQEIGYNKNIFDNESMEIDRSRVKVIELRKSDDFRETSVMTKAFSLLFGERNELYMILGRNYIRLLGKKSDHRLSELNIINFEFVYEGKTELNNEPVYGVSIKDHNPRSFVWTQYKFHINVNDLAIVKIEHQSIANPSRADIKPAWLIEGKYFDKSEVNYRKVTGKYYPVFIHVNQFASDASAIVEADGQTKLQYTDIVFLLTNVYEDDYSRIKWKDAEDRDKDLYDNETPYNEEFWSTYNTVKANPLRRDAKELEKNRAMNEQFKSN